MITSALAQQLSGLLRMHGFSCVNEDLDFYELRVNEYVRIHAVVFDSHLSMASVDSRAPPSEPPRRAEVWAPRAMEKTLKFLQEVSNDA